MKKPVERNMFHKSCSTNGVKKDPLLNYENWLINSGIISEEQKNQIHDELKHGMDEPAWQKVFAEPEIEADTQEEEHDLFAPVQQTKLVEPEGKTSTKRLVDAISDGLYQSMERHPNTVIMGQDIAEYGGVFKITENFLEKFGKGKGRNTPITESSILGAGYGLAIKGFKAI